MKTHKQLREILDDIDVTIPEAKQRHADDEAGLLAEVRNMVQFAMLSAGIEDRDWMIAQVPPRMGDATLHHLGSLPLGIAQGVMHLNAASPIAGSGLKDMTRNLDSYIQRREQSYQQATPDNTASYAGATVGEVLPWLTGVGELRALGILPKATSYAGKLGSLALEGSLIGAAQPVTSGPQTNLQDLVEGRAPAPS